MRRPPRPRVVAALLLPAAARPVPVQPQGVGLLVPPQVGAVPLQTATRLRPVARVVPLPQVAELLLPGQGVAALPQGAGWQPVAARVARALPRVAELLLLEQAVAVPPQRAALRPVVARAVRAPPEVRLPALAAGALPLAAPLLLAAALPAQLARANRNRSSSCAATSRAPS
jgi:hypothetical protein